MGEVVHISETDGQPGFDPEFEDQFKRREVANVHGTENHYVDVKKPNTPYLGSLLLAPGYLSGIVQQKTAIQGFYDMGYRVISNSPSPDDDPVASEEGYSNEIVQDADALFHVLNHAEVDCATIVGHSRGFVSAVLMAKRWSNNAYSEHLTEVEQIIGVAPYALVNSAKDQITGFVPMLFNGARQMSRHPDSREVGLATAKGVLKNPRKTFRVGWKLKDTDIFDDAVELARTIPVHALFFYDDQIVKPKSHYQLFKRMAEEMKEQNEALPLQVSTFIDRSGDHSTYLLDQKVTEAIHTIIRPDQAIEDLGRTTLRVVPGLAVSSATG